MLVRDIIKICGEFLELKDIVKYVENKEEVAEEIESEINLFLLAVNMVNSSIASSYIELVDYKKLQPNVDKKIFYKDIDKRGVVEVKKITTESGIKIEYKAMPDCIVLDNNNSCLVEYSYLPSKVDFNSEIDYYVKLNSYIFAMGVVAEFLYIKGNIDDAYMWDKKFKNSMFNLLRPKRNIVLPERRW